MDGKKDNIYVYIWEEFSTVYIGRTINPKSRHYQHRHIPREKTYKFSSEHGVEHPRMIIIENDLSIEEGVEREKYWINYYRENTHYHVLNKKRGGQTGKPTFPTEEELKERKNKLNEYKKQYREAHREELKLKAKEYRKNKKETSNEPRRKYLRKYYEEHKEEYKSKSKEYRELNKEKISEYNKKYCEEHKEYVKEHNKTYYEKNKENYFKKYYIEHRDEILLKTKKRRSSNDN